MTTLRAWHFVGDKLRDGRPIPPIGFKLVHSGPVIPCEQGLHASEHPFDALKYAPGTTLCLVDQSGKIVHEEDKVVASERTIIKRVDAEYLMRRFAKDQALSVIHLWNALDVVKRYLEGDYENLQNAGSVSLYASAYASTYSSSAAARSAAYASSYFPSASYATASYAASCFPSPVKQKFVEKQRAEFEKRVMDLFCL